MHLGPSSTLQSEQPKEGGHLLHDVLPNSWKRAPIKE